MTKFEDLGTIIRQFFRNLFGSRYVEHLEEELMRLRQDQDRVLHDRDVVIASLREEKQQLNAKIIMYENTILPRSSRMGAEVVAYQKPKPPSPKFNFAAMPPTKSRWQAYQEQYYKEQEETEKKPEAAIAAKE
jgi:hypothetical protein